MIKDSELVLSPDGSLYHIHLTGETLADNVILVGDPGRVEMFKTLIDSISYESYNREMHAVTGTYHRSPVTVLSTGMGCDNIDIVMSELDAAANIDLQSRQPRQEHRSLRIVRIGTCGSLQAEVGVGSLVASRYVVGLDGLLNYYAHEASQLEEGMAQAFAGHVRFPGNWAKPYCASASKELFDRVGEGMVPVITATAPGFYAPQGRHLRIAPAVADLNEQLASFAWDGLKLVNLEMETSAIYGLSSVMGHQALTVCLVIANRPTGTFLNDYHDQMRGAITRVLDALCR